jgi:hypothetical protein
MESYEEPRQNHNTPVDRRLLVPVLDLDQPTPAREHLRSTMEASLQPTVSEDAVATFNAALRVAYFLLSRAYSIVSLLPSPPPCGPQKWDGHMLGRSTGGLSRVDGVEGRSSSPKEQHKMHRALHDQT